MKLGTQSVNAFGESAFTSGPPSVLPTNPNQPFAKLIVKSELGQIVQQWMVLQNKCTLGSASSCALRCQLPGIAPYHALLVMGARQVFIRALAPKLSRNGVVVNELLLTDEQCSFEVAGHQFELIRATKPIELPSQNQSPLNKMKFTLARSMDTNPNRAQSPQPKPNIAPLQTLEPALPFTQPSRSQLTAQAPSNGPSDAAQATWISELIQSAMQPLERQLHSIIEPLAAVQSELDKRARRKREQRKAIAKPVAALPKQTQFTTQIDVQPQIAHLPEAIIVPIISPVVEEQLAKQTNSLAALTERLTDLKHNLGSLERAVAESKANIPQPITPEPVVVPVMSPLVESQLAQQSESLQSLNDRLNGVTNHLGSLERIVSDNFVTVISATSAPAPAPIVLPEPIDMEPVNEALRKINSVAEQIQGLTGQLNEVKSNLGSLEQIVNQNLSSTNKLVSAPAPASSEALQQLSKVAEQLSQLLQEMNQRQAAIEESEISWRENLRAQIDQLQNTAIATESSIKKVSKQRVNTLRGTCPTSAALILNGNLRTIVAASAIQPLASVAAPSVVDAVESDESDEAIESIASVLSAWSTTAEPALDSKSSIQQAIPVEAIPVNPIPVHPIPVQPIPAQSAPEQAAAPVAPAAATWSVAEPDTIETVSEIESNHADFIEETIEDGPIGSQVVTNELPSWWTDDDKSIYQDSSSFGATVDATWNPSVPRAPQAACEPESLSSSANDEAASASSSASRDEFSENVAEQELTAQNAASSSQSRPGLSGFVAGANWAIEAGATETDDFSNSTFSGSASFGAAPSSGLIAGIPFDEIANEEPTSEDTDSQALSSLLERFGVAREPKSELIGSDGYPQALLDDDALDNSADIGLASEADLAVEEAQLDPEPAFAPVPAPIVEAASKKASEEASEESVEDYMKRLMARMRGGSAEEESKPTASSSTAASSAASTSAASPLSAFNSSIASKSQSDSISPTGKVPLPSAVTERNNRTTSPFNPEHYVPKALAPEKTRNMAAMRELANTSARSAIQVSARRRYGTAIALKLAIALTGLGVGVTLVMINGLNVNIGLIATIASFLVAMIWGFDAVSTIRPLLYSSTEPATPEMPIENPAEDE